MPVARKAMSARSPERRICPTFVAARSMLRVLPTSVMTSPT